MGLPAVSTQRVNGLPVRTSGTTDSSVSVVVGEASLPYIHSLALRGSEQLAEDLIALKQKYNGLEADNRRCKVEIRKLQKEQVVQQHEADGMEATNQRMYIDAVIARRTGTASLAATQQPAFELESSLTARTGLLGATGTGTGTLMQHMRDGHKRLMAERDALVEELSTLQRSLRATRVAALEAELCDMARQAASQDAAISDLKAQLESLQAARARSRLTPSTTARQAAAAARSRPRGHHPTLDVMGRQIAIPPGQDSVIRRSASPTARAQAALRPTKAAAFAAAREAKSSGRRGNTLYGQDRLDPRPSVLSSAGSGSDNMYCSSIGSLAEVGHPASKCGKPADSATDDASEWTVLDEADDSIFQQPALGMQAKAAEQTDAAALGHAASVIQAAYRGRQVRKAKAPRAPQGPSASPQYLQAMYPHAATPAADLADAQKELRAATHIQATFRGRQVRQALAQQRGNQRQALSPDAASASADLADMQRELRAATVLQATFRGRQVRQALAQQRGSHRQGLPAQQPVTQLEADEEAKMARAATQVQAVFRGHRVRMHMHASAAGVPAPPAGVASDEAARSAIRTPAANGEQAEHSQLRPQSAAPQQPANTASAEYGTSETQLTSQTPSLSSHQATAPAFPAGLQQPQLESTQAPSQDTALVETYLALPSAAHHASETRETQKTADATATQEDSYSGSIPAVHGQGQHVEVTAYTLQLTSSANSSSGTAELTGDGSHQKLGPEQKQAPRRPSRISSGLVVKRSLSARPPSSGAPNSSTTTDSTNAPGDSDPDKGRAVKKSLTQSLNGMARLFGGRKSGEVA